MWSYGVFTTVSEVTGVVPSYHPENEWPVNVGVGRAPYGWSYVTDVEDGVTDPPFASSVTVYVLAVHLA